MAQSFSYFAISALSAASAVGFAPERAVGHRQADHPPDLVLLLLDLGERGGRIALEHQRHPELVVRAAPVRAQAQHRAE